jgi:multidrug efflux system membrane fusion protein
MTEHPKSPIRHPGGWSLPALLLALALIGGAAGAYWYFVMRGAPPAGEATTKGAPGGGRPGGPGGAGGFGGRPTPVAIAKAATANVDVFLNGLGTVTPVGTVTVRTRIDGQLMAVHFREGQVVKAGDLLAEIDPRPYQVQLAQAQGQMQKDEALLANARLDLERYRTLFAQDSGSKQQLDTQAALVRQYEGVVKIDQSQIDNARLQLDYTRITAPIAGRLGLRQVDTGNMVRAGDASGLVVITQLDPIAVIFTLPEDNVQRVMERLRRGERIAVDAYDRAGKVKLASGTLITLDNQIDPATGAVKLKAQFDNKGGQLFPSQFVNVRMLIDTLKNAIVVPAQAVQRGARGTFVYVVKDDKTVTIKPVKPGQAQGNNIAIEEGLAAGESVVIDGAERLREGSTVELPGDAPPAGRRGGKGGDGAAKGAAAPAGDGNAPGKDGAAKSPRAGGPAAADPSSAPAPAAAGAGAPSSGGATDMRALFAQLLTQAERDGFRERMQSASGDDRQKIRGEMRALLEKRAKEKGITLPPPGSGGGGGFGGGGRQGD